MNILYVSSLCSEKKFQDIFNNAKKKPGQPARKYHFLMAKGLKKLDGVNVTMLTSLPITNSLGNKKWFPYEKDVEQRLNFTYLPFINLPIVKHIFIFFSSLIMTIIWCKKHKNGAIICDILNIALSSAALLASKICHIKSTAIVTDIPLLMLNYRKVNRWGLKRFCYWLAYTMASIFMTKYDSYVILTEFMNPLANPKNAPYLVIEGLVDSEISVINNSLEEKYAEKTLLYAGGLEEKYGLKNLIEAFLKLKDPTFRLHIYGSGEMEDRIRQYQDQDKRICFYGTVLNREVIKGEIKAHLLVNPRFSNEEYVKYSFPSKNLEYMASGTPMVTTKLPGMPKEYWDHVYLFDDESVDDMKETLEKLLSQPVQELHEMGSKAKNFVLVNKVNTIQAGKVVSMLREVS